MKKYMALLLSVLLVFSCVGAAALAGSEEVADAESAATDSVNVMEQAEKIRAEITTTSSAGPTEEYEADVVVVGAGGSGCPAVLSAAQSGAKVIAVEKASLVGGSAMLSLGVGAQGSAQQEADPDTDFTVSEWLTDWLKQQNYMVSAPMIYKYISNSGETVDWMIENGAEITFVGHSQEALADDPIRTYHLWGTGGYGTVAQTLISRAEELGAVVLLNTSGREVLMENGAVAGLRAVKSDGTEVIIHAKAVILATGGYGADTEAMMELLGRQVNGINLGTQTGDGIDMARAVGAALEGEESVEYHGAHAAFDRIADLPNGGASLSSMAIQPSALWVNVDGYRFTNEDICYDSAYIGNVTATQGDHYYVLFDQTQMDILSTEGEVGLGMTMAGTGFGAMPPASDEPWLTLEEELEAGLATGASYKADTLEELAELAGVNADNLLETVAEYNAACAEGVDGMYGKDSQFLFPVENGPFYFVTGRATELCTLGGVKITTDFEVVNTDNEVIPGLYAAGVDCSGSIYNNSYVSYEGVTMGWSTTSGRLAGIEAAAYALG